MAATQMCKVGSGPAIRWDDPYRKSIEGGGGEEKSASDLNCRIRTYILQSQAFGRSYEVMSHKGRNDARN